MTNNTIRIIDENGWEHLFNDTPENWLSYWVSKLKTFMNKYPDAWDKDSEHHNEYLALRTNINEGKRIT